jgi:cytochrome c oxidase assembly factor CtaG/cytochrome c2
MKRLFLLLIPAVLLAHSGEPLEPHDLWTAWRFDPGVVIPLAIAAFLYARGSHRATPRQRVLFWSGWATLIVALVSPLHPLGEALFSAHMAQHEILMLVAAPLLVLSRPLVPLIWTLPLSWRRALGRLSRVNALAAWIIHGAALWIWHVPALFQATLTSELAHAAQHASFVFSALLFWWSLFHARGSYGAGIISLFTTAIHTSILGALLTFSQTVWYPAYAPRVQAWGWDPLPDQQLGGLIMWIPGGIVYLLAALTLLALVLRCKAGVFACALFLISCHPPQPRGAALITHYGCGTCHVVSGIRSAHGLVGPPLTGIRDRYYVAGMLVNTPENLARWIHDPKSVNERTAMPRLGVTPIDAADIANYLYSENP